MNSEARAIKSRGCERILRVRPFFSSVALSCHREIVPEVILYFYDVYCNNKYYISTFYKSRVFITVGLYLLSRFIFHLNHLVFYCPLRGVSDDRISMRIVNLEIKSRKKLYCTGDIKESRRL